MPDERTRFDRLLEDEVDTTIAEPEQPPDPPQVGDLVESAYIDGALNLGYNIHIGEIQGFIGDFQVTLVDHLVQITCRMSNIEMYRRIEAAAFFISEVDPQESSADALLTNTGYIEMAYADNVLIRCRDWRILLTWPEFVRRIVTYNPFPRL